MNLIYTALYRKWRPVTFQDVAGQDTIVRTLKNQLSSGHIAHAYLFCGSRGTGKTSTAKIFARAINCISATEHGPCGECEVCVNLSSENNMDIVEIDAASNNGVDEIRDLRDKVRFPPAIGKFKVYIIDEVHMLSIGAFNALLKTLEEPPAHVVFILATTEPHKLPATILSRCQRFDFKRIPHKVLTDRMKTICDNMNITAEADSLHTIARWAEGGMRDALSLLDQCISFCGSHITNDDVLNILGTADQGFLFQVVDHILSGNLQGLLRDIGRLSDDGKDFHAFLRDLLHHMRNLLIVKSCSNPEDLLDAAQSTLERLKKQAKEAGEARLVRTIELLSPLESEMRYSSQPRILLELAAVKLCRPHQEESLEALQDRVEALEKHIRNGTADPYDDPAFDAPLPPIPQEIQNDEVNDPVMENGAAIQSDAVIHKKISNKNGLKTEEKSDPNLIEVERSSKKGTAAKSRQEASEEAAAGTADLSHTRAGSNPVAAWPGILENIREEKPSLHVALMDALPRMEKNGVFTLIIPPLMSFNVSLIEQENNRSYIEKMIKKATGQELRVKCMLEDQADEQAVDENYVVEKAIEVFGADLVEVVDEDESKTIFD